MKAAREELAEWDTTNKRLYGLIIQALPDDLRTSIFNAHNNDGIGAATYLHTLFAAKVGSANDYSVQLTRLQTCVIDDKADISVADLRLQYDGMKTAVAAIKRIGRAVPDEETLMVFFDNTLPISYSQIRQFVRDKKHRSFFQHYEDYVTRVDDEVTSRRPTARAFVGRGSGPDGRGSGRGNPRNDSNHRAKVICFRCLGDHARPKCTKPKARCPKCDGDHHASLCPKGNDSKVRARLPPAALRILDADVTSASAAGGAPAALPGMSYAHAVAPPAALAAVTSYDDAHAAATAIAETQSDIQSAINAYASTLRVYGFASCAVQGGRGATSSSMRREALVDSMATYWVVDSISYLWTITNAAPKVGIETAAGTVRARAIGVALIQLLVGDKWECYEVPNVIVLDKCASVLYSTRVMRDLFGFTHDLDGCLIRIPGARSISITDDSTAFYIPVIFTPRNAPRPRDVHKPKYRTPVIALAAGSGTGSGTDTGTGDVAFDVARPTSSSSTPQAIVYHRLGFPYKDQWCLVPDGMTGHGIPPGSSVSSDLPVRDAVIKGRSRAAPFRKVTSAEAQPPPGALVYMDFAGPLIESVLHRFTCYCGTVDAGSGYGRVWPDRNMTAPVASSAIAKFVADVASKMGFNELYKPAIVRSDKGSAFVSFHFREILADRQIHLTYIPPSIPRSRTPTSRGSGALLSELHVVCLLQPICRLLSTLSLCKPLRGSPTGCLGPLAAASRRSRCCRTGCPTSAISMRLDVSAPLFCGRPGAWAIATLQIGASMVSTLVPLRRVQRTSFTCLVPDVSSLPPRSASGRISFLASKGIASCGSMTCLQETLKCPTPPATVRQWPATMLVSQLVLVQMLSRNRRVLPVKATVLMHHSARIPLGLRHLRIPSLTLLHPSCRLLLRSLG
jgi:hypothetical protein